MGADNMTPIETLKVTRRKALDNALRAACSEKRSAHEAHARACDKIIDALRREDRETAARRRIWSSCAA
jgi:hypothetical protein